MSSSSSFSTILLLFINLIFFVPFCASEAVNDEESLSVNIPAVLAFGDSILDTGNNNHLLSIMKANFAPYGKDFVGKVPTGRFSNGKVPVDMIADLLGVKKLVPAYLDPNLRDKDLPTGVCFASAGTGYDPLTSKITSVLSMTYQLEYFKQYISRLKRLVGEEKAKFIVTNSLYLVSLGSNDLAITYYIPHPRLVQYDISSYTNLLTRRAAKLVQELYALGARRIGVLGAPPIGCIPSQRTLAGGLQRLCSEKSNQAAKTFNSKLSHKLDSLNRNLTGSRIVYIDAYTPLLDIIQNPHKYGFKVADKGCCSTGYIEAAILCNPLSPTCRNASEYVFWDSYHPTEAAYNALVGPLMEKYVGSFL